MRILKYHIALVILAGLVVSQEVSAQQVRYTHPRYDISFEASSNWIEEYRDFNGMEFRVTNPNHNMRVSLSFVSDCRNPERYLRRMSGLKGMVCLKGNYDTVLNDREAVMMCGNCLRGQKPYTRMVVGFPMGSGLYIMEICCPEDCTAAHQERVKSILHTVRIGA